jgi:hypothetical protein
MSALVAYMLGIGTALLLYTVFFAASAWRHEAHRRDRAGMSPKPICGCGHNVSFHDDNGCHHLIREPYVDPYECGCVKYTGPEPLPDYIP